MTELRRNVAKTIFLFSKANEEQFLQNGEYHVVFSSQFGVIGYESWEETLIWNQKKRK